MTTTPSLPGPLRWFVWLADGYHILRDQVRTSQTTTVFIASFVVALFINSIVGLFTEPRWFNLPPSGVPSPFTLNGLTTMLLTLLAMLLVFACKEENPNNFLWLAKTFWAGGGIAAGLCAGAAIGVTLLMASTTGLVVIVAGYICLHVVRLHGKGSADETSTLNEPVQPD